MSNIQSQIQSSVILERTLSVPPGGPKCLPINLDFAAQTSYDLDYSNQQRLGYLDMCQTLWVDNKSSAVILYITIAGSQQVLQIPAGIQGYFTCLCPNPIKMNFASAGGTVCQVTLLNFPVWS